MPVGNAAAVPWAAPWKCQTGFLSDLLVSCGRGDESAFVRLFDVLYPCVALVVASGAPASDVDELVRDAFVSVWRTAPDYDPATASAVEWVMRIAGEGVGRPRLEALA